VVFRMKKAKIIMIVFIALMLLFVTACSSSNNQSSNEPAKKSEPAPKKEVKEEVKEEAKAPDPVEIRFTWWGDAKRHDVYNAIADEFEKEYPYITVKREFGGWGDYWDKLATQVAGGNAPDVVSMHQFYVSDYAKRNALLSLNEMSENGVIDLSDFPQGVTDSGKIGDDIYMVAKGVTMTGIIYNEKQLNELGIEAPDMDWTWDDFVAKATEINAAFKSDDKWGVGDLSAQYQNMFRNYLRQQGLDLYTEEGKLGFAEQNVVDWFTMWDDLRKAGVIPPPEMSAEYKKVSYDQSMFVQGKLGLTLIPANQIYLYQEHVDGDIHMVRYPTTPGGQDGEFIEGAYLSVTEKSAHQKEAAMFINFFVNNEAAAKIFKVEQGPPASPKMQSVVLPLLEPAQQRAVDFIKISTSHAVRAPYAPTGATEVNQAFNDAAEAISFGADIQEETANFMNIANGILK
jgi:multiple sugar transport system substrate-binding protein